MSSLVTVPEPERIGPRVPEARGSGHGLMRVTTSGAVPAPVCLLSGAQNTRDDGQALGPLRPAPQAQLAAWRKRPPLPASTPAAAEEDGLSEEHLQPKLSVQGAGNAAKNCRLKEEAGGPAQRDARVAAEALGGPFSKPHADRSGREILNLGSSSSGTTSQAKVLGEGVREAELNPVLRTAFMRSPGLATTGASSAARGATLGETTCSHGSDTSSSANTPTTEAGSAGPVCSLSPRLCVCH